jgi:HD-GYP domain-containing protein (c-di-GMP phosphodiesterase class II)
MANARLADLIAALSQAGDLGMGQPPGTAARSCLVATALARSLNLPESEVAVVSYTTLLQHAGCTAYAHETVSLLGLDDVTLRGTGSRYDFANPRESLTFLLLRLGEGTTPLTRMRAVASAIRLGGAFDRELSRANCDVAMQIAAQAAVPSGVSSALGQIYERWDGKGYPQGMAGEDIAMAARVTQVASQAVLFHDLGGAGMASAVIRQRAGSMLDPIIAHAFLSKVALREYVDVPDPHALVLDAEPAPVRTVTTSQIDAIAKAFGLLADLKSPFLHGHSGGVAHLATSAARHLGLPDTDLRNLRRAGLLHDIGRIGVSSVIWNKPGPLGTAEWEQVRLHPYLAERMLSRSSALAPIARLAGMHHERLDGSGYHRQAPASEQSRLVRILAAADAYQAMTQDRPHRPAWTPEAAASEMDTAVARGLFDPEATRAVLEVAGHLPARHTLGWPAGLSDREVEVLRLAARGATIKGIATTLAISPKTVDHHIQHIYAKIGVSSRAGAALFAMEHDLVQSNRPPAMG